MRAQISWHEACRFVGQTDSGHAIVMDGPIEFGGRNLGPRPMEMLLLGLGGCTAFDVVQTLHKARQKVLDCTVDIDAQRAEEVPRVYTRIHIHFRVYGLGLSEKHVSRCIGMSANKYCSASIMLGKTAEITHDYEVLEGPAPKQDMTPWL